MLGFDYGNSARRVGLALILSLAGFGTATTTVAADPGVVRIAVEGAFPPFNYVDSNGQLQGFDVDVARALCEAAEMNCEFVIQEWTGMIPNLLSRRYDAIISSLSMSAERREKVAFTPKYYDSPSVFIVRKGSSLKGITPADLKDLRLGITAATSQETFVKRFYADMPTTVFHASPDLYKGLADGSVDIIMEDKLAIYDWLANTKDGSCCEFTGPDIKDVQYFGDGAGIALRPGDTALLARFSKALEAIQSNDTYDTINAKYFPFSIR
jgi:polar amino acid transport system substrate-binding protein